MRGGCWRADAGCIVIPIAEFKRANNFERSIARCELCVNYSAPKCYLSNSIPRFTAPYCQAGGMHVRPTSICDKWQSDNGQTLRGDA